MKASFLSWISLRVSLGLSFVLILRKSLSAGVDADEAKMEGGLRMSVINEERISMLLLAVPKAP